MTRHPPCILTAVHLDFSYICHYCHDVIDTMQIGALSMSGKTFYFIHSSNMKRQFIISFKWNFFPIAENRFSFLSFESLPLSLLLLLLVFLATFFVLTGAKFKTNIFFYLKALSLSDMLYLLAAFGYIYELFFLQTNTVSRVAKGILYLQD